MTPDGLQIGRSSTILLIFVFQNFFFFCSINSTLSNIVRLYALISTGFQTNIRLIFSFVSKTARK